MNTLDTKPNCPQCEQNGQVTKVSHLYLSARERKQPVQPFAPPSGKRQLTQTIHPDMVVVGFSLIALLLLYNMINQQPDMLLPVVIVLLFAFAAYIIGRKKILARYQVVVDAESAEKGSIQAAIGEWMKLYYCERDKGVFDPAEGELIPLAQMRPYLFSKLMNKSTKR